MWDQPNWRMLLGGGSVTDEAWRGANYRNGEIWREKNFAVFRNGNHVNVATECRRERVWQKIFASHAWRCREDDCARKLWR